MDQPQINNILRWGIENSDVSRNSLAEAPKTTLDPNAIAALFGVMPKSDADVMKESMHVIDDEDASLTAKEIAFENFEMLIQNLDNANMMEHLGMWTRLVSHLDNKEAKIRAFAAWCCNTAVQNNVKTQERLLIVGAIPTLVKLATEDPDLGVRKKAIGALSSEARNFQPGLDAIIPSLPAEYKPQGTLDANDMHSIDSLISKLRENVKV